MFGLQYAPSMTTLRAGIWISISWSEMFYLLILNCSIYFSSFDFCLRQINRPDIIHSDVRFWRTMSFQRPAFAILFQFDFICFGYCFYQLALASFTRNKFRFQFYHAMHVIRLLLFGPVSNPFGISFFNRSTNHVSIFQLHHKFDLFQIQNVVMNIWNQFQTRPILASPDTDILSSLINSTKSLTHRLLSRSKIVHYVNLKLKWWWNQKRCVEKGKTWRTGAVEHGSWCVAINN